jgi:tight adherence protein C
MSPALLMALSGVFFAVALGAGSAASWWLVRSTPEQKRLRQLASGQAGGAGAARQSLTEAPDPALARLTRLVPRSTQEMSRLQRHLARAGYPRFEAAVYYSLAELVLPIVCGGAVLMLVGMSTGWPLVLLAAIVGYFLPRLYVNRKVALRRKAIRNGLPDALDLLTVCVEAGSGLDQSIAKATEELHLAHPLLAEELRLVATESRAGKPRVEALRNLAQRTGVDEIRELVSMLTQTDRFGTSVAEALRTHADVSRTKRRQRAEERAAKVSVKLVFPLALCLSPALYVVCFGPVGIAIYRNLLEGR